MKPWYLLMLACSLGLLVCGEEQSVTPEEKKQILHNFLISSTCGTPPLPQQIANLAGRKGISHEAMTAFTLQLIDDIYYRKVYGEELDEITGVYAYAAIRLLEIFHPDMEETDRLLQEMMQENYLNQSRTPGFIAYCNLHKDKLWKDPFIVEEMAHQRSFEDWQRSSICSRIERNEYPNASPQEQEEIVRQMYQWALLDVNIPVFYQFDSFLLEHLPNYADSPERFERLGTLKAWLDARNAPKDTEVYRNITRELESREKDLHPR